MTYYRSVFVNQMVQWIDYSEANGKYKTIIDIYNSHTPRARNYKLQYDDAWCAGTVGACAVACGYTSIIPMEVSVPKMVEIAKKMGIWIEADDYVAQPADFAVYDWNDNGVGDNTGSPDHIGAVIENKNGIMKVAEGNYSDAVKYRNLSVNGRYIRGFICPKYDEEGELNVPSADTKDLEVDGLWGPATTRRLQEIFGTPVDGIVSNQYVSYRTANAGLLDTTFEWERVPSREGSALIKAIQKKLGSVVVDGYLGPQTIRAMQSWLGTPIDGRVDNPSLMVKALQKWCNEQE